MRYISLEQFNDELDDAQASVLDLRSSICCSLDSQELRKLVEGDCRCIKQVAFGVVPTQCGHFHYGVRSTLRLMPNIHTDEIKDYLQVVQAPHNRVAVAIRRVPFAIEVDGIIVFDSCKEYRERKGIEKLRTLVYNVPLFQDN